MTWEVVQARINFVPAANWERREAGRLQGGVGRHFSVVFAVLLGCLAPSIASACYAEPFERVMFFDQQDLDSIDAPTIVDVTIEAISSVPVYKIVARARVNKTIRGTIEGDAVNIVLIPSSCDRGLEVGVRGIVIGVATRDLQGAQEIAPIFETRGDRDLRRRRLK